MKNVQNLIISANTLLMIFHVRYIKKLYFNIVSNAYRSSNTYSITHVLANVFDIVDVVESVEEFLISSQFFEEFKMEFVIFKIVQLNRYILISWDNDYFISVKKEFINLNVNYELDYLPDEFREIFEKILIPVI